MVGWRTRAMISRPTGRPSAVKPAGTPRGSRRGRQAAIAVAPSHPQPRASAHVGNLRRRISKVATSASSGSSAIAFRTLCRRSSSLTSAGGSRSAGGMTGHRDQRPRARRHDLPTADLTSVFTGALGCCARCRWSPPRSRRRCRRPAASGYDVRNLPIDQRRAEPRQIGKRPIDHRPHLLVVDAGSVLDPSTRGSPDPRTFSPSPTEPRMTPGPVRRHTP